jgi:mRNA-degrading endonuclease toxin of MazEF toxin-antitoxin module
VIDVRALVTVAEITTTARKLSVEVELDHEAVGLAKPSVVNCDGLHTIGQSTLTTLVGTVDDATMRDVCAAVGYALGC